MAGQDRERRVKLAGDFESSDPIQRDVAIERGISFGDLQYWLCWLRREGRPRTAGQPDNQTELLPTQRC